MKRYLLFGFDEPLGGIRDFICDFNKIEDISIPVYPHSNSPMMLYEYQVYDTTTGDVKEHVGYKRIWHARNDTREVIMQVWHDELINWIAASFPG